jgi:hypothetical protein
MHYGSRDAAFCRNYTVCTEGGTVGAVNGTLTYMFSRTTGVAFEVLLGQQTHSARLGPRFSDDTAIRQSRGAVVIHHAISRSLTVVGGPSMTIGDVSGVAGRLAVHTTHWQSGLMAGIDLVMPLRPGVGLVVLVRVNVILSPLPAYWPGEFAATAGAGLTFRVWRRTQ